MASPLRHFHILGFPGDPTVGGGILDALRVETHGKRQDLLFEYRAMQLPTPARLFERDGRPWESVCGQTIPRRFRFMNIQFIQGRDIGESLIPLDPAHPDRLIYSGLAWSIPESMNFYQVVLLRSRDDTLLINADGCLSETVDGPVQRVEFERDWSPPPLSPARMVPMSRHLWRKYGGDPVTVRLQGRNEPWRLFIGGMDTQPEHRPQVGAVLNLGDDPSRWCANVSSPSTDRWAPKGEGSHGMTAAGLAEEAGWVIDHLRRGERVLVHCSAGMNRSASVCCAVLILLERLSAEAALKRVRHHHPWSRPDPRHWLALRWLAHCKGTLELD